jgi:hypothetical protein
MSSFFKDKAVQLLNVDDIQVNRGWPWNTQVHDERVFRRVVLRGLAGVRRGLYGWVV